MPAFSRIAALAFLGPFLLSAQLDPLASFDRDLASGEVKLEFQPGVRGWLDSVLAALDIPASSQTLVFSKTSAQFRLIHPGNPRALYFNDDMYVGWVPGGPILELSAADPNGVGVFYTLEQDSAKPPRLVRDSGQCLQCHESARTQGIPGHLVRSVYPGPDGQPLFSAGTTNVDQTTPMAERWGGWYVSGPAGEAHRGNSLFVSMAAVEAYERAPAALELDLGRRFDVRRYLSPDSDPVALLVLTHQVQMHNAIARAGEEARRALAYQREMTEQFGEASATLLESVTRRIERPAEEVIRRLLFTDETPLAGSIAPVSGFAADFERRGPFDSRGRSLRQLDLESRLLRYRCSYLIYSPAFRALPEPTRRYIHRRLGERLAGDEHRALREILVETHAVPPEVFEP